MKCKTCGNDEDFVIKRSQVLEVTCKKGTPSKVLPDKDKAEDIVCVLCHSDSVEVTVQDKKQLKKLEREKR